MKVGFIGLGNMGAAVARNIQRAGFEVVARDLDRGRAAALEQNGAQWAESPAEVAAQCNIVVTMVFGPEQLTEVLRGADGLLCGGGMRGKIWVDMTTSSPSLVRELAAETRAQGGDAVDAPVTGLGGRRDSRRHDSLLSAATTKQLPACGRSCAPRASRAGWGRRAPGMWPNSPTT